MADPNVHPRLRGVVGLDTVDLPAAVQLLAEDVVEVLVSVVEGVPHDNDMFSLLDPFGRLAP